MLKPMDEQKKPEPVVDEVPKGYYLIPELPSKGTVYPEGTKIYSRPLTVLELKHLATMTEQTADGVINEVLKGSVKGIDYRDLVVADKIFIIMWQRSNTYKGDRFGIEYVCPACGERDKYDFDSSMVEIPDVADGYSPDREYDLGSAKVQLEQPRVRDVSRVVEFMEKHPDADADILGKIAYRIWKVDGNEIGLEEAYDFCVNLPAPDFVKLNGVCAETEISINPVVNVVCKHCSKAVPIGVSFRPDFFVPEYTGW